MNVDDATPTNPPAPGGIDWTRPWFASVEAAAHAVVGAADWRAAFNRQSAARSLGNTRGLSLRLAAQSELPAGVAYESFIDATGRVPTRDNLHDFMNALVWLSFPLIKRQLNVMQATEIARLGVGSVRGPVRDAATIFDENGALLIVSGDEGNAVADALRERRWHDALFKRRRAFGKQVQVLLFGHALLEKLTTPHKAITAHLWVAEAPEALTRMPPAARQSRIDEQVSKSFSDRAGNESHIGDFNTGLFTPLPVLGVPGWWPCQGPAFYADTAVFRPQSRNRP